MKFPRLMLCLAVLALALFGSLQPAAAEEVSAAEIARIRYELGKVELKVKEYDGQAFELSKYDKRAFRMVKDLATKFPNDPKVKELVEEAKKLYKAIKGNRFEVTPEMLAYRNRAAQLEDAVARAANDRWVELKLETTGGKQHIAKPLPVKLPPDVDSADMEDHTVIFENVPYEQSLFVQSGRNWIPIGDASRGYYFLSGSDHKFDRLYEALRRYRNQVKQDIGDSWSFVGTIVGPDMLVPGGGKDGRGKPTLGWIVQPTAIYIHNTVLVELDDDSEHGAAFAGESNLDKLIKYSVTSVPDEVEPAELIRIYVTALKEKNFDLHLECIDPGLRKVGPQIQGLRYNWEVQQKGLERIHAHAEPVEVGEIKVTAGNVEEDLEDFFGDEETKKDKPAYKEERVIVTVRLFDVNGRQTVRARYVTLIRRNSGRWYIYGGSTLTF